MSRLIHTIFITLLISVSASAQVGYWDYKDESVYTVDGTTYTVFNNFDKILKKGNFTQEQIEQHASKYGNHIALNDIKCSRIDKTGLYTDGHYAEDSEEVSGIIQGKLANDDTVYAAVRKAFTKEELMAHPDWILFVFIVVDNTGRIIETATGFKIRLDYVIQPEQVHVLETTLKNTLVFTLDQEKASKFEWFEGQIMIRFKDYIEDRTLSKMDNFIESPNF